MPAGVPAMVALANLTLGSAQSIVTFSSISGSYRDLVLVINGKITTGTDSAFFITLNSDFGNNYNDVLMTADSTGFGSTSVANAGASTVGRFDTNDGVYVLNFLDYSATDKHKTFLTRSNISTTVRAYAHRWANTSAVTSIRVAAASSTFATGSTFALYGVSSV
jgi:hypothetical protein